MMSTSKKTRHKILSHKIIVSRFNAKQIHVFYIYFLNRNPDFLIAFYTSICRLHEQLYSSWWGLVVLRQKRRNMRRIKREIVIIGVECSCIYYGCVCIVNVPCQCYFRIYGFQCAAKASLKVILYLSTGICTTYDHTTLDLALDAQHSTCSFIAGL